VQRGSLVIEIRFEGLARYQSVSVGPAPWFRLAGNHIRQGPAGDVVAQLVRHQWSVGEQFYSRLDCRGGACVRFEDAAGLPGGEFGPFATLFIVDGTMYAGDQLLGKFAEETQLWHCFPTETYWPVVVLESGAS
jgi:hypothetical protein